jgi:hypothetical protein
MRVAIRSCLAICDAALAALASYPEKVLDESWWSQTSYFERLQREHPEELREGLERLAQQVEAGSPPNRPGRSSVVEWTKGD